MGRDNGRRIDTALCRAVILFGVLPAFGLVATGAACVVTGTAREVRGVGSLFSSVSEVFSASASGIGEEIKQ